MSRYAGQFRQHARFYGAAVAGVAAFAITRLLGAPWASVIAGDVFFASYLGSMALLAWRLTVPDLRARARNDDEGIVLIVVLTTVAIAFSFQSIFALLGASAVKTPIHMGLALASIPLGWATLHMLFAFHYARLYYVPRSASGTSKDAGGLEFLDTQEPGILEFIYFSFTIGATAQTSDVNLKSTNFRKVVLFHGIASFVFNTVLVALAVSIGASAIQ